MDKIKVFDQLLLKYELAIKKRCFFWTRGNEKRGEDAYQEVLRAMWEQLQKEDVSLDVDNAGLWVINITRRTLQARYSGDVKECKLTNEHVNSIREADADERNAIETVNELKAYLGHNDKLLLQYIIEGYNNNEIAILVGVEPNAINQRKYRLVKKMREIYNKLYNK